MEHISSSSSISNKIKQNISFNAGFALKTAITPRILPFPYYHKALNCSKFVVTRFPCPCGYNPNKKGLSVNTDF